MTEGHYSVFQPLDQWSSRHVAEWMAALNLYQYAHVFQRHNIDGQSLLTLNQDKLQVRLSVCLSQYVVNHPGKLSLAIPVWLGMSISQKGGDGSCLVAGKTMHSCKTPVIPKCFQVCLWYGAIQIHI